MAKASNRSATGADWEQLLTIVVPAYNEEEGIVETLSALKRELPSSEIIVVDDGSTDATARRVADHRGVRLLRHAYNRGYGAALRTGMEHACRDYIAWFDADNEHRVEDLKAMVARLHSERLAAVLGQRRQSEVTMRGLGKFVIGFLARLMKVKTSPDLNCGLRVFRRSVISRYLRLLPDGYSASVTSTVLLVEQGYPHAFHLLTTNPRIGQSKVALSDGFEALVLVLRVVTLFAPLRVFLRLSLAFTVPGLVYGIGMALATHRGFPVAAALLVITGAIIGSLGLIADQISQIRLSTLQSPPTADVDSSRDRLGEAGSGKNLD